MFFMDIIKLVIKIKIQLTFLIKFCVTDLAVSTSVIVNMSRFIPPKRPWPQRSFYQALPKESNMRCCWVVCFLPGFWQFFFIKKNKKSSLMVSSLIPVWHILLSTENQHDKKLMVTKEVSVPSNHLTWHTLFVF